jgi:predicted metal-dependent hydrolase
MAAATVLQGGRAKAYRPLPPAERDRALAAGLDAYERGDYFLAHEILEPAWMGTADPLERELHQGLIKLAAAYVHGARGNPRGIHKNLVGARARLAAALAGGGPSGGLDLTALIGEIDERLARPPEARPPDALDAPSLHRIEESR